MKVDVDVLVDRLELGAAVLAGPERGADGIEVGGVVGIDADHGVVKGALGQAVETHVGSSAVVAAEHTAGLIARITLVLLLVGGLAEQSTAVGTVAAAEHAVCRARGEGHFSHRGRLAAYVGDRHLLAASRVAYEFDQVGVALDRLLIDLHHPVALLQSTLGCWTVFGQLRQHGTGCFVGAIVAFGPDAKHRALPRLAVLALLLLLALLFGELVVLGAVLAVALGPAAALGLDDQVDRAVRTDIEARAAPYATRQSGCGAALLPRPRGARVGRLPESRARSKTNRRVIVVEAIAQALVGAGVQRVGVLAVEPHVDGASLGVDEQHSLPRGAAVLGAEHPALVVLAPEFAEGCDEHDVGVLRVDLDMADLKGVAQTHVGERGTSVDGLVDAVAPLHGVARVLFAGADPEDVAVAGCDRNIPDRGAAKRARHIGPSRACVLGREHPAAGGADKPGRRLLRSYGEIGDPTHRVGGTEIAP